MSTINSLNQKLPMDTSSRSFLMKMCSKCSMILKMMGMNDQEQHNILIQELLADHLTDLLIGPNEFLSHLKDSNFLQILKSKISSELILSNKDPIILNLNKMTITHQKHLMNLDIRTLLMSLKKKGSSLIKRVQV